MGYLKDTNAGEWYSRAFSELFKSLLYVKLHDAQPRRQLLVQQLYPTGTSYWYGLLWNRRR